MSGGRLLCLRTRLRGRGESASARGDALRALRHRNVACVKTGMGLRAF